MEDFGHPLIQFIFRPEVIIPLLAWVTFWKGLGLWESARKKQLTWFVILLLINTLGLLEISYIYYLNRWELGSARLLAFLEKKFKPRKKS